MKTRKEIAYAYPTSPSAEKLGCGRRGCFYVALSRLGKDGAWLPSKPAPDARGYDSATHPDLLAIYAETEGEPWRCTTSKRPDDLDLFPATL